MRGFEDVDLSICKMFESMTTKTKNFSIIGSMLKFFFFVLLEFIKLCWWMFLWNFCDLCVIMWCEIVCVCVIYC